LAHIAIRGARRADALMVSGNLFSGTAAHCINIGDPSPGGSTVARGVSIVGNKFSSYGTAALRLRHCSGLSIRANCDPHGTLLTPGDSWENNDTVELQGPSGTVQSCKVVVVTEDYTATLFDRFIAVAAEGVTVTLPRASELSSDGGQRLTIRSRVAGTTVARQGTDTIDGATSVQLAAGESLDLVASLSTPEAVADYWEPA
jgi:hypothetical protein